MSERAFLNVRMTVDALQGRKAAVFRVHLWGAMSLRAKTVSVHRMIFAAWSVGMACVRAWLKISAWKRVHVRRARKLLFYWKTKNRAEGLRAFSAGPAGSPPASSPSRVALVCFVGSRFG